MPHQQHVWDVALEVDADGRFAYDEVDLSTMRQSSKTTTMFVKQVWRLTRGARLWGPQRSTYTAQKRQMARNKLERDFAEVLLRSPVAKRSFTEITNAKARPSKPSDWKLSLNNGSEHMLFGRGNYLQIDAPTKTAGHGDTLDDGNIDEAFAHVDDSVEQAMRPAQATRFNAQLYVGSTAGDEKSFYWYGKVVAGRAQIERKTPSRVAYFEWSLPDDADIDDEDVWWEFMPALGHTITPEFVRSELERARRNPQDGGEGLWRRAYGNQWVRVPPFGDGGSGPITVARWNQLCVDHSEVVGGWSAAIDMPPDYSVASFAAAGRRPDGSLEVSVVRREPGTDWVVPFAKMKYAELGVTFRVASTGPASYLLRLLPEVGVPVEAVTAGELAQSTSRLVTSINEGAIHPLAGPDVPAALVNATIAQRGEALVWSRVRSSGDISALVAATIAVGGVTEAVDEVAIALVL